MSRRPNTDTCGNGHKLTEENTYVNPLGYRKCRTCIKADRKRAEAKYKAKRGK